MRRFATMLWSAVIFILVAAAAHAHHSIGREYVSDRKVTVTGKVTSVQWNNPHIWITLDVTGADGKTVKWQLETRNPSYLTQHGWKKDDLTVGTLLTVEGNPARSGESAAWLLSVTLSGGKRLLTESGETGGAAHH